MASYKCAECGRPVSINHGVLSRTEQVTTSHGEVITKTVTGEGLGTWTCAAHAQRFVTVMRDLSGGKEASKMLRQTPVTVKRHTKVRREP
jgi:hypothetical protein